jgi:hypothetical protein
VELVAPGSAVVDEDGLRRLGCGGAVPDMARYVRIRLAWHSGCLAWVAGLALGRVGAVYARDLCQFRDSSQVSHTSGISCLGQ